ncbi:hypothetical protein [Lederbergia galactosidilytica]|uniref:Uncharacterized protein n=1 Tax=Lederbergia galactosidilytica TaxID=217031 RepID=A0A0Q9XVW9_9BACI|nr:hypothetical protein [Lederbergia galactosidilytica]KRG12891.1 hypothetical protein ACA29_09980 [Lederbergia galactosidilytica]KRG13709.1 hypothetical protein ACA30_14505 [Virgibacillus soli]MBP1916283.1 hypothetical protein [Lederbergia galactosidilytica]OAK70702.1 hypothetical protein ABB05_12020 [Lederbergia galactosidilytica]
MRLYEKPIKAYLHNDLAAFESQENDKQLIYFFEKGYVTVLGEFESDKYVGGKACIIFNQTDVISVGKGMLRFVDEEDLS